MKMQNKKAQASFEAMLGLALIFFIFLGTYAIYLNKNSDMLRSKEQLQEREDCLKLTGTIMQAFLLGDKTTFVISVQHPIGINPGGRRAETKHSFCTLPINQIYDNQSSSSPFSLDVGKIQVENNGGRILLSHV